MSELVAVRCRPEATGAILRRIWDDGDAALLLPVSAPAATITSILEHHRPAALLEVLDVGAGAAVGADPVTRTPLDQPLPVRDDVALAVATSGSTGRPKGVELTHAALQASTNASNARLGCRQGERWALILPTHHIAGVQVLLRSWALGTDAEVVSDLASLGSGDARYVSLVPTQLRRLLDAGADVSRFERVLLGGAAATPELLERARAAGVEVVVSYGMSETCGGCVYDGQPLDGVEVELREGRIRIRGDVLFAGYRGERPDPALDGGGWFTTGDLGAFESDGTLRVLGRADDVIISGGENVPVAAVEAALRRAPGVAEVAVTGRPDPEWGEVVVAVVVPTERSSPPSLETLRAHVRAVHPAAWAPREVLVVEALPRNAMGKVGRAALDRLVVER